MTAYEEAMSKLAERIRALEVKLKVRDRVDEIHADSLKHVIDKFDERVETLESRAHGVMDRLREFDGYVERLEALETKAAAEIEPVKLTRLTMSNLSESVNTLVLIAQRVHPFIPDNCSSLKRELGEAIKPFEAQK